MPDAAFFNKLGLLVITSFIDEATTARLRDEARVAVQKDATVVDDSSPKEQVKPTVRRTKTAIVSRSSMSMIHSRLTAMCPRFEEHFGVKLEGCEQPQLLVYGAGDFFSPHIDGDPSDEKPQYVRNRKLSVTIFLNHDEGSSRGEQLRGGSLVFYGLINQPGWETVGFSITSEPGLLVAFPADVLHEITPITNGKRYSLVSWFF